MKKPRIAGLFSVRLSEVEVVVAQLFLEATFLEQVVDDAALGQVGLGDFHGAFAGVFNFLDDEIIFEFEFFFVSAL